MIPKRGPYRGNAYKIFDEYNDIHIFIEDAGFENLYKILFHKNGLKVTNIFSKNGKRDVLRSAKSCEDPKCVFIVDRDWDDLFDCKPTLKNVVVLDMYSIENYLIDYDAFASIVLSDVPKGDINSIFSEADYKNILKRISDDLRPLFECFAAIQLEKDKDKGCSHNPGYFQKKDRSCSPNEEEIDNFIKNSNISIPKYIKEYFFDSVLCSKGHGKFMLHYMWTAVRHHTQINQIHIEKLMIRLAQLLNTAALGMLNEKIKSRVHQQ